ncbi:MAG: type II toxin-antitoxin system ParD family antitoxin [Micrococcales bacterium]|nr:type II toxin-antitoxin system ParD family antitoxin [Micrococcales bacterium]
MRTTKQMSITLPLEMAAMVEKKVASGEYASDSEVVRDGLRALVARDRAVERWLQEVVVPTYDRVKAGQEATLTADEVRERLRANGPAAA